ncbi:transcriptional repressor [Lentibacter algarum]|uniref:transcriptional repressor n=1 Tax=Lentibacter algarum TaxID=576131 RepID=UPI001C0788FF|nr:transcriptional repressor [Lentibacter algarum]MBU2981592.1 transcriptional repressor [Lentibacter algarum]
MTENATPKTTAKSPVGFGKHDHAHCKTYGLSRAEAVCEAAGVQFTPIRRRVLEILLEAHEALGAYDVLARLSAEGLGSKPPVAYRALGFLVDNGLAHRIEKLNAYIACAHPGEAHDAAFMICRACGTVAEAEPRGLFKRTAGEAGFQIETLVIEAEGLCPDCGEASV